MEDRYLYKAKTTPKEKGEFNNVWVTGNLIVSNGKYYIHPVNNVVNVKNEIGRIIVMHEVIPNTICQCTTMPDKNKKLVFEHDIVWDSDERAFYKIIWNQEDMCWNVEDTDGHKCAFEVCYGDTIEVIGNIFDNPELLESEDIT